LAHIPTEQEFIDSFATAGIPTEYLAKQFARFAGNRSWLNGFGQLKDYRKLVGSWWLEDRAKWKPPSENGHLAPSGAERVSMEKERERIQKYLTETYEQSGGYTDEVCAKRKLLRARDKELMGLLGSTI
jgi:hypothetical protein